MKKVFIDGQEGTTGLQIHKRLKGRDDIELMEIPQEKRKDIRTKTEFLNEADLAILCLPDEAAKESVALITNPDTKVVDPSTAHRINPDWVYGIPELTPSRRDEIAASKRVTNPGCWATCFISLAYPLVSGGILPADYPVSIHGVSGYSGGGKKLIERYEGEDKGHESIISRPYAFSLNHKHVPEMQKHAGLTESPLFSPSVGAYYNGMLVHFSLYLNRLKKKATFESIHDLLSKHYEAEKFVRVMPLSDENCLDGGFLSPTALNSTNMLELFVNGNDEQVILTARLDNLGKGASGAVVQNMNIMLGFEEGKGLEI